MGARPDNPDRGGVGTASNCFSLWQPRSIAARLIKKKSNMQKLIFQVGETVVCNNIAPLKGKKIAPPLKLGASYTILGECFDKDGNQHLNVGLISEYEYISSFETGENLPDGHKIHWCHPSRFSV